jgi:hypothetical protein
MAYYGLRSEKYCQILGEHNYHVVNAHIWPNQKRENLVLFALQPTDVDNPRNILRLHGDIKHCFEHEQVTFIQNGNGSYLLKVLDPGIRSKVLRDTNLNFDAIDEHPLLFPSGKMPWRCWLVAHSIFAHKYARNKGWLPCDQLTAAEVNTMELVQFSLDGEAQARMQRFLKAI